LPLASCVRLSLYPWSDSVKLRFEKNACLMTVELRRDGEGRWRVFYFQSRAG
jgi:hypothetical protein